MDFEGGKMDAKLKIDLTQGILEVEGSEKLVIEIYNDFKQNLSLKLQVRDSHAPSLSVNGKKENTKDQSKEQIKPKHKSSSTIKTPSLVKDLDLLGKGKASSLKDFVNSYSPKSGMEWNLLFVYYLQKILEISAISINHVYTCYKHVNTKSPNNIYQSLIDTARRKGYINTDSIDAITVTIVGENYAEHDMARKEKTPEGVA